MLRAAFASFMILLVYCAVFACSENRQKTDPEVAALRVAVATNFKSVFDQLNILFQNQTGQPALNASFASSGLLYAQIINGAPFDIFLSADIRRAQQAKLYQMNDVAIQTYAIGQLVLWTPNVLDSDTSWLQQYKGHIAIANPTLAPYGEAAQTCLQNLGISLDEHQLLLGSSVGQAFHFVASGAAEVGIVAKSQVLDYSVHRRNFSALPKDCYTPIEQQAVVVSRAFSQNDTERIKRIALFMKFLNSKAARALIEKAGYLTTRNRKDA